MNFMAVLLSIVVVLFVLGFVSLLLFMASYFPWAILGLIILIACIFVYKDIVEFYEKN